MVKYIRYVVFALAAVLGLGAVVWTTQNKLGDLRIKQSSVPYEFARLKDRERQLYCMTKNIYWEAASEPAEGKLAVAQVVLNRVESGRFPADPCQVIYQKNVFYDRVICQFSWFCEDHHKMRPIHKPLWEESYRAAQMVLMEGFRLPALKGALYYHADYVNPQWRKVRVAKIGRHIFYKDV